MQVQDPPQVEYEIYLPNIYEMNKMDDAITETTTIIVISFLENMPEGKLMDFMRQNGYLPISAFSKILIYERFLEFMALRIPSRCLYSICRL